MVDKVVVHYRDGRLLKGHASHISPYEPVFQMTPLAGATAPVRVALDELKAVFFVRTFDGDPEYAEK